MNSLYINIKMILVLICNAPLTTIWLELFYPCIVSDKSIHFKLGFQIFKAVCVNKIQFYQKI